MAFSQKHAGKMFVPWFNSNEWKQVYGLIFDETSTEFHKEKALKILYVWKSRTPKLAKGVEGTLIILDALLQKREMLNDENLRILYGTSIMRFLNLCGASDKKQGTLYKTAKQNNLPNWLIDLRHDMAHDQIVPSMSMLQMGLNFCLNWLKLQYWDKQLKMIVDINIESSTNNVKSLIELYCQLNLALFKGTNEEQISVFVSACLTPYNVEINENTVFAEVLEAVREEIEDKVSENEEQFLDVIIKEGSLFKTTLRSEKGHLHASFVAIWQDLVDIICRRNLLGLFIKKLVHIVNAGMYDHIREIASLWLVEICKRLLLCTLPNTCNATTSEFKSALKIDAKHANGVEECISKLRHDVIYNPNVYTLNFLNLFLQVCKCTDEYIAAMTLVMKNYIIPVEEFPTDAEFHTLEECSQLIDSVTAIKKETVEKSNSTSTASEINTSDETHWKLIKDTTVFQRCSIGVLAHQSADINPFSEDLLQ